MLETVSKGIKSARNRLRGYRQLMEENVDQPVRDIRVSLLEADLQFNVVRRPLDS